MFKCKHCSIEIPNLSTAQRANHTRWCASNPQRATYCGKPPKQFQTDDVKVKRTVGIKKAHAAGKYTESTYGKSLKTKLANGTLLHTEEAKAKISKKARASKHRRLLRSVRPYIKKDGTTVLLDSSWEEALAKRLDDLNVEWVRPVIPTEYVDEQGITRNYFPDFFLPEHNLFLDPKNPAAMAAQKKKIDIVQKQMYNLVIIDSLNGCQTYTPK